MAKTIDSFHDFYRFLSNFWLVRVVLDGVWYPSVENAFQAAKTVNATERIKFVNCTAAESKKLGRSVTLRLDWEDVKVEVMRKLLMQKFSCGELRQLLLDTDDAILIEGNTWNDRFWGMCPDETGKFVGLNHLGKLLMEVREHYRRDTIVNEAIVALQRISTVFLSKDQRYCEDIIAKLRTL